MKFISKKILTGPIKKYTDSPHRNAIISGISKKFTFPEMSEPDNITHQDLYSVNGYISRLKGFLRSVGEGNPAGEIVLNNRNSHSEAYQKEVKTEKCYSRRVSVLNILLINLLNMFNNISRKILLFVPLNYNYHLRLAFDPDRFFPACSSGI